MEEVSEINEFMDKMGEDIEVIWGVTFDEDLGDDVKITLIATGFGNDSILEEMMKEDELDDDEEPYDETSATVNQIQQDTKTKWMKHLYPSKTDGSQLPFRLTIWTTTIFSKKWKTFRLTNEITNKKQIESNTTGQIPIFRYLSIAFL